MTSMKRMCARLLGLLIVFGFLASAQADDQPKNANNKVTAYVQQGPTEQQAVVTLWMSNVNPVGAICLPFKFAAADSFWLDSMVTKPYRAGNFQMLPPKYERDKQTLLVNLLRDADSVKAKTGLIPVGEGVVATLHLSAKGKFPLSDFKIATVQLPPENVLLYVTETFNSVLPEFSMLRESPPSPGKDSKHEKTP